MTMTPRHLPLLAVTMAVIADLLCYDAPAGLGTATAITAGLLLLLSYHRFPARCLLPASVCCIAIVGMLVDPGPLDTLLACLGLGAVAACSRYRLPAAAMEAVGTIFLGWTRLWAQPIRDAKNVPRARSLLGKRHRRMAQIGKWIVPILITGAFAGLFVLANPIFESWGDVLWHRIRTLDPPSPLRLALWISSGFALWGLCRWCQPPVHIERDLHIRAADASFMLRTLVLCNLLFAFQHLMDFRYLLFGQALPEGMTYAGYAHRGAYPLLATAVLAAVFVLLCVRPGGAAERSRAVRWAVAVWLAQNVILCGTAIWRLLLYVEAYGLTRWRLAAILWMGLVACGLTMIVLRMWWQRDNRWLIDRCLTAVVVILASCAVLDVDGFIARWNVARHLEHGAPVDTSYLLGLGPAALPPLRRLHHHDRLDERQLTAMRAIERANRRHLSDWRGWNWRAARSSAP